jgi:hypothetical protein
VLATHEDISAKQASTAQTTDTGTRNLPLRTGFTLCEMAVREEEQFSTVAVEYGVSKVGVRHAHTHQFHSGSWEDAESTRRLKTIQQYQPVTGNFLAVTGVLTSALFRSKFAQSQSAALA